MATYSFSPEHTEPTKAQALSVSRPEWFNNAFTAFGTLVYDRESRRDKSGKLNPFPNRMMKRSSIDIHVDSGILKDWADIAELKLGPLISSEEARHKVLCLLYHYRHLDGKDLKDLPCTDLITHRVRIAEGTKPASNLTQKR